MKKYLISGMAALMFCGVFTSCTRDTDLSGGQGQQQKVMETYEQAFLTRFGQPAADQDWGFGSSRSNTRATGEFANHVGAYPDANMWTSKGFLAPDPLTPGQKLRVQFYFQMVQNPGGTPDKGTLDFFMQQVYDGGDDPMDGKSPEKYLAANGSTYITSGEHMDHLTVGPNNLHIFNFNNGNCSTNPNVADRDQTDVNNTTQQHSDQIQLMLNTPTSCFGYANSDASYVRKDRWRLVSGEVIDAFCDDPSNGYAAFLAAHQGVVDKKCYWDDFKRSYIGFDFDMIPDSTIFAGTYVDKNGNPIYDLYHQAKDIHHKNYEYFSIDLKGQDKVWNGTALVDATTIGEWGTDPYGNRAFFPYMPGTTKKIHKVVAELNQFCGEYDNNWNDDNWKYTVSNNGQNTDYARIDYMTTALNAGKLPKNDKEWVVVGNCADGYYSDWIVSFLPAEPEDTPNPVTEIEKLRVIAEDLSVGENTDFDFNDVVFDVIWTKTFSDETKTNLTSQKVEIKLLAAGGTLLLYVDGKEVHEQFGVDQYTMVNTDAKAHGLKGKDDAQPVTWETSNYSGSTIGDIANSIVVKVIKNGEEYLIRAERGHIASKIGVKFINDQEYEWCYERQDIEDKYSLMTGESPFQAWVQGIYPYDDWYTYAYDEIMKYRNKLNGAQGN